MKVTTQVKRVSLKTDSLTLNKGDKVKLSDLAISTHTLSYKSDDKTIVKVSKKGVLQAVGSGIAKISIQIKDSVKEPVDMTVKVIRDKYDTPLGFDTYNNKIPHRKMTVYLPIYTQQKPSLPFRILRTT